MSTPLYLRLDEAAPGGFTLPSGFLGAWFQVNNANAGANANALDINPGSSQSHIAPSWLALAVNNTKSFGHAQFLYGPLIAQTIPSGNWTIAYAADMTDANVHQTWTPYAGIYLVNGSTGAIRTTIFALGQLAGVVTGRITTGELTCYSTTTAGNSAVAQAGDYLAVEIGLLCGNVSSSFTPTTDLYTSGTTAISSDNVSTSSAQSLVIPPATILTGSVTPVGLTQAPDPYPPRPAAQQGHFSIDLLEPSLYFAPPLMGYGNITQETPANPPAAARQTGWQANVFLPAPKITPVALTSPPPPNPPAQPRQLGWKADARYFIVKPTPPTLVALQPADPTPRRPAADPGWRAEVIATPASIAVVPPLSWVNNEMWAEPYPKHGAQPSDWNVGSPNPIPTPSVPTPIWLSQPPPPNPPAQPRQLGFFVQPQITFWGQILTAPWFKIPDPAPPSRPAAQQGWFATATEKTLFTTPTPMDWKTLAIPDPIKRAPQEGWSVFSSWQSTFPTPPVAALTKVFDLPPPRKPAQLGWFAGSQLPSLIVTVPPAVWIGIQPTVYPPAKPRDEGQSRLVIDPSLILKPTLLSFPVFQAPNPPARKADQGWQVATVAPLLFPPPTPPFPILVPMLPPPRQWNAGHFAQDIEPSTILPPPSFAWMPRTPDPGPPAKARDPGWFTQPLVPIVTPVALSWQGRFPDGQPPAGARQVGWITTSLVPITFPPIAGWLPQTPQNQPPTAARPLGFEADVLIIPARSIPFIGSTLPIQFKRPGDQTGFYTFPQTKFLSDIYASSWMPTLPLISPPFRRAEGWFCYVILPPGVPPFPALNFPDILAVGRGEIRLWIEQRHARTHVEMRNPRIWREPKRYQGRSE